MWFIETLGASPAQLSSAGNICWDEAGRWGEHGKALRPRSTLENKTSSRDVASLLTSLQTFGPTPSSCVPQACPSSAPRDLLTGGYLHSGLGQPQPLAQFFTHKGVRVVSLVKKPLQLVELFQGEIGPTSPLLDFGLAFVLHPFRILFAILRLRGHWRGHHEQDRTRTSTRAHSNTHTHTQRQKQHSKCHYQICLQKDGGSCPLPEFLSSSSPGCEEEDPGDAKRSTLGGRPRARWAFTHASLLQLWPQLTSSLFSPQSPALPREHQINSTNPLLHSLSPTRAQKSKEPHRAGHRTRCWQESAARPRTGLLHRPFPECWAVVRPAVAAAGSLVSLKLAGLIWEQLG